MNVLIITEDYKIRKSYDKPGCFSNLKNQTSKMERSAVSPMEIDDEGRIALPVTQKTVIKFAHQT